MNPFNILYGMIPNSMIERNDAYNKILDLFLDKGTKAMTYMILGIRGSGKTVLMRSIAKELRHNENWIVVDLNPLGDFVSPLAEALFLASKKLQLNLDLSIDVHVPYVTFHLGKNSGSLSPETVIRKLITDLKKKGKRVLITIDEINATEKLKSFANFYQSLIGEDLPIFLLMTGLIENVDSLINAKSTSFLSRSPKIYLNPLDLFSISKSYQKELSTTPEKASELAKLTKGYAFAYQVIGNVCYSKKSTDITPEFLAEVDTYLGENGYGTIWNGMNEKEKEICLALAECGDNDASKVRDSIRMTVKNFNNYRLQMIRKGYLISTGYGKIDFGLPRFKEYVLQIRKLI